MNQPKQQPSAVVSVGPQLTAKAIGKSRHDTATCPTCLAEKKTKATTPARTAKRRKIKAKRKNQENEGVTPASTGSADGPSMTAPRKPKRIVHASLLWYRNGKPFLSDTRTSKTWDINMDAFTWFRDNKADYVPSTYDRFLAYRRSLESRGSSWTGFSFSKFMCYFIYFGAEGRDAIQFPNPYNNNVITIPRGSRVLFSAPTCPPTLFQDFLKLQPPPPTLNPDGTSAPNPGPTVPTTPIDCWICYWERTNDGPKPGSALHEQLLVEWLEATPDATVKDCIARFAENLRDNANNERDRFADIIRKVALIQDQKLVLRPHWRGPPSATPRATS